MGRDRNDDLEQLEGERSRQRELPGQRLWGRQKLGARDGSL